MGGRTRLLIVWLLLCVLPIQAGAAFAPLNCPEALQVRENAVAAARSALPNSTAIAHGFAAVGKGLGSMPSHHHAPGADEGHDCCVNLAMSPPPAHPPFLRFLDTWGIDVRRMSKHPYCRTCIDWSERRHHLAGAVGIAIYKRCLELKWVDHHLDSRAVSVTRAGKLGFERVFGIAGTAL